MLKTDFPDGWTIEGENGEYRLTADDAMASLLLLAADDQRPLEVRLAEIDEQFISTGVLHPEAFETREEDGEEIVYRRYRLGPAPTEEDALLLHQYFFTRTGVLVLLQVETSPGAVTQEDLFFRIFHTLKVKRTPDPFAVEDPFAPSP
jgi:hypothetical protein